MAREIEITRWEVIRTQSFEYDKYGNLMVTALGENGKVGDYKIGEKRAKSLEPEFIVGRATKIGWAFFNKEYIATASLYDGETATGEPQPQAIPTPPSPKPSPEATESKNRVVSDKDRQIAKAVALKASIEHNANTNAGTEIILAEAENYLEWLLE